MIAALEWVYFGSCFFAAVIVYVHLFDVRLEAERDGASFPTARSRRRRR